MYTPGVSSCLAKRPVTVLGRDTDDNQTASWDWDNGARVHLPTLPAVAKAIGLSASAIRHCGAMRRQQDNQYFAELVCFLFRCTQGQFKLHPPCTAKEIIMHTLVDFHLRCNYSFSHYDWHWAFDYFFYRSLNGIIRAEKNMSQFDDRSVQTTYDHRAD